MDLGTVIGLIAAAIIVVMAMVLGGDVTIFINIPSLLVVVGGTVGVVMAKFTLGGFLGSFGVAMKAFMFKSEAPEDIIQKSVELADAARKGGLLSLEGADIPNPFMKKGISLLVDGHEPDVVKQIMGKDLSEMVKRHETAISVFVATGDVAPAMGMIGTLIGLVQMLSNMDDPKSIGPAMAVALLTTLYGAMIANMAALPLADKLTLRNEEEKMTKSLILDALLGIQAGQNPRVIEETLKSYLAEGKRGSEEE